MKDDLRDCLESLAAANFCPSVPDKCKGCEWAMAGTEHGPTFGELLVVVDAVRAVLPTTELFRVARQELEHVGDVLVEAVLRHG